VASCFSNILGIDSGGSGFDRDALSPEVEYGSAGPDEFEVVKDAGSGFHITNPNPTPKLRLRATPKTTKTSTQLKSLKRFFCA